MIYFKRGIACFLILCMVILSAGCKNTAVEESAGLGEFVADQEQTNNETPEVPEKEEQSDKPEPPDASETKPQEKPVEEEQPSEEQKPAEQQPEEEAPKEEEPSEEQEPVVEEEETKPAFSMENALKVVTFNIKNCYGGTTLDQVAALLKEVDGDLVGLQEVDCNAKRSGGVNQVQAIAEKAGYPYCYFTPCIAIGDSHTKYYGDTNACGQAILSKYPILKSEVIWPSVEADYGLRNFARHEIDINGKTVAFYNCHLDFTKGRFQYREVQDKYLAKERYAICVGDFNETLDEMFLCFDYEKFYSFAFGEEMNDPYTRNGKQTVDHIVVSKDTISWYDEEVKHGYYDVPHNGASDHNLIYGYINLLD